MNPPEFENIIKNTLGHQKSFRLEDLSDKSERLSEYLEESGLFFWTYDNWGSKQYIAKEAFFEGSIFSLHLTDYEIRQKILIAPARFLPFSRKALPLTVNGKHVPLMQKKVSLKPLNTVYSLDEGHKLIALMQKKKDWEFATLSSLTQCPVDVYDLQEVDVHLGNHLRIELHDGLFTAQTVCSESLNLQEIQGWCEAMEKALVGVIKEFGPITDIYTQLELAYFYGPELLRKQASLALRDFFKLSKNLTIDDYVFRKIIRFRNQSPCESPQAQQAISSVIQELSSPVVSRGFYSFVDDSLKKGLSCLAPNFSVEIESELERSLAVAVRRVGLWLRNNTDLLNCEDLPPQEMMMFYSSFCELQRICDIYCSGAFNKEEMEKALQLNSEILQQLMSYLQTYYTSEK